MSEQGAQQKPMDKRIAWIGLGNMGRGMARNLLTRASLSQPLVLFNRTTSRTEAFVSSLPKGHTATNIATSATQAAKDADVVFTSLGDDKAVLSVYEELVSAAGGLKGKLVVETSTILPETTEKVASMVRESGGEFAAGPVFGAPAAADAGQLVFVLAGEPATLSKVTPYCDGIMSKLTIDLPSASPGQATLLKLTGNTFILSMIGTLAEGHTFAERSGLGSEALHRIISAMLPGPFAAYSKRMMEGDYVREVPLFGVDLARKDAGHVIRLAENVGVDMKITKVVDERLEKVKQERGESGDLPAVYGVTRKEAGLDFVEKK